MLMSASRVGGSKQWQASGEGADVEGGSAVRGAPACVADAMPMGAASPERCGNCLKGWAVAAQFAKNDAAIMKRCCLQAMSCLLTLYAGTVRLCTSRCITFLRYNSPPWLSFRSITYHSCATPTAAKYGTL